MQTLFFHYLYFPSHCNRREDESISFKFFKPHLPFDEGEKKSEETGSEKKMIEI